jgi:hypothetical protein
MIYANGDIYEGGWKNNKKNSTMLLLSDGKKYIQLWDNDNKLDEVDLDYFLCSKITISNIGDIEKIEFKITNEKELLNDDLCEIRCPISFEYLFNPVITPCNHIFSKKKS